MNLSPNVSPTKQQKTTRMTTLDHWMKKDKSNDRVVDESMNSSPNELKDTESVDKDSQKSTIEDINGIRRGQEIEEVEDEETRHTSELENEAKEAAEDQEMQNGEYEGEELEMSKAKESNERNWLVGGTPLYKRSHI